MDDIESPGNALGAIGLAAKQPMSPRLVDAARLAHAAQTAQPMQTMQTV